MRTSRTGSRRAAAGTRRLLIPVLALLTIAACATPDSPSATGTPASPSASTTTPTPTPLPTSVSTVVTASQVAAVRKEAARQGAVATFARTDPSGIVVVRPVAGVGSKISAQSLTTVVKAEVDPAIEVKVSSTGSRKERLAATFERYAASHSLPGVYLTFAYRKDHSVFTLATNAPVESLRSLLREHRDDLVVTYATPGCQVCGG